MDFGVLGPLRVTADGGEIDIPGHKERVLLARLVAQPGRTVPFDALADALWAEEPPASSRKVLQTYVLRLRNALEPARAGRPTVVVTDAGGYRLAVPEECVDAVRLGTLVDEGRRAAREGRHAEAVARTTAALDLWRGPAYSGFEQSEFAVREARRLEELRLTAEEVRWGSEVALGNHHAAVPALETLVVAHPWREGLWAALVLALYRAGRQGDALAAYARARTRLDEDLGVEPGAELRELHRRILAQDTDLDLVGLDQLPPGLTEPDTPMLGRTEELAELARAWDRVRRGSTVVAQVVGQPGSGRRRLLQAFASRVAEAGVRVHDGPADHPAGPVLHVLDEGWCETCARTPRAMVVVLARPGATAYPVAPDPILDLAPLEVESARQLLATYLRPEEAAELAASAADRQPGALHALGRARVRSRARERIGAATTGLGEAAAQLTSRRDEIAEAAVTWHEHDPQQRDLPTDRCPWRGLAAYGREDRAWFAGRDRLAAELLARVASSRLVAVVGASGSGKSSLVHAGLLGGLADGVLPGSDAWVQVVMRPGAHPMRELSRAALAATGQDPGSIGDALARLLEEGTGSSPGRTDVPRVLVVDQFEETWTLCHDPGEREAFLDSLVELASVGTGHTAVVVAVRADYVAHLADHAALARLVADNTLLVGVPTPAEVQRAIEVPAARAGLVLDAGLAATIVDDAGSEPGLLPLLSAALTQLWQARSGARLGYAAYVGMGGLPGAIAHLAEQAWQELPEEDRGSARALLLRLAGPGAGSTVVRRRVALDELVALPGAGTAGVVDRLVGARLLTVSEGSVEVAHEALFREWPRLAAWLAEDVTGRAVLRRLAVAASEWDAEGREPQQLWRGTRLVSGLEVAESYPDEVTTNEREFLEASGEAVDAEQRAAEEAAQRTRRQNGRLRRLLAGVVGLLVVALVAGGFAVVSRQDAAQARDVAAANEVAAEAKQLAAQAVNEEYHDLALLQAVEAVRTEESPETLGALLTTITKTPKLVRQVRTPDRFLRSGVSTDGSTVLLAENEPVVWGVDAVTGIVRWTVDLPELVAVREIDGGEAGVLAAGLGGLSMLDAATGATRWTLSYGDLQAELGAGSDGTIANAKWVGADAWVSVTPTHVVEGDAAGRITRTMHTVPGHQAQGDSSPALWPDGRIAVVAGDRTQLIDPHDKKREPEVLPADVAAVSPDGTLFLAQTTDGADAVMRVHRTDDLSPAGEDFRVPGRMMARWSPDGSRLAIGSAETILLRDGRTGAEVETLTGGHSGAAIQPVFAGPDGTMLWSPGRDGVATAWDLSGERSTLTVATAGGTSVGSADREGRTAVAIQRFRDDLNRAYLVDPRTGELGIRLTVEGECECNAAAVAIDPQGTIALVAHDLFRGSMRVPGRGTLGVWSVADGSMLHNINLPLMPMAVAVDPTSERAVVNGDTGFVVVDLRTATAGPAVQLATEPPSSFVPLSVAISPDGRQAALLRGSQVLVVSLPDGNTELSRDISLSTGSAAEELTSVVWSTDGSVLVVGSRGGRLQFLDSQTLEPVAPPRLTVGGFVVTLAISPDGSLLVNTGTDGEVRLWDTATWSPLGQPLVEDGLWTWAAFTDGGRRLVAMTQTTSELAPEIDADPVGTAGRFYTLPTDADAWLEAACSIVGRELSQAEWDVIRPGQPWRPTCGDG
ncbi:BTAD domain-containing putative transcriptional regulator [Ornithinimicrobium cerasi]|nr:BTAD domain-containing putative transcriptional regulator [Ornithinimicrobium cerasi]